MPRTAHSLPRTRSGGTLFALTLLLLLAAPASAQRGEKVFDQTFPLRAGQALSVGTAATDVTVRTGEPARVEVYGRGGDVRADFERLRFSAEMRGDRLEVKENPRSGRLIGGRRASFEVVVTVPERVDYALSTASGDVTVARLRGEGAISTASGDVEADALLGGPVAISTASGDVSVRTLEGRAELSTSSGDFSLGTVRGPSVSFSGASGDFEAERVDVESFSASTASGDVEVRSLTAGAGISTSSGDVQIGAVEGPLTVSTASGDVRAALSKPGPVEISTGSGGVSLTAPAALAADLDLRGGSVRLGRGFAFDGETQRRSVVGRLGRGGPALKVSTGSGSISLDAN